MKRREILIDSELYQGLEVWAQALGYTVDRLAELCILWGSVYLVAMAEGSLDPAAECRAFEARLGLGASASESEA